MIRISTTIILAALAFSPPAQAKMAVSAALGAFSSGAGYVQGKAASTDTMVPFGGLSGLFALGADFTYFTSSSFGLGGYFRYYSTSDNSTAGSNATTLTNSATAIGAMAQQFLNVKTGSLYMGAGMGILDVGAQTEAPGGTTEFEADMGFGLMFAIGGLVKLSDDLKVGVENMRHFGLGSDLNGQLISDWTIKGMYYF